MEYRMKKLSILLIASLSAFASGPATDTASVLARILVEKGVIGPADQNAVESASQTERVDVLIVLLQDKGVLASADLARLSGMSASAKPTSLSQTTTPAERSDPSPPVTADSRFPVTVYGTLLTNAVFNAALGNIQDIPLFASKQGSDASGGDKNFAMTARQSRFGLRYQGPDVRGAKLIGQLELDLLGGKAAFPNGISMDIVRLRLAFGRLDWKSVSLVAGQDWSIFAPLNPTTFAQFAIPGLSSSGNPWIRAPQIRAEFRHSFSETSAIQWQIAAADPNMGDYPSAFLSTRTPGIGERGRMPGLDTRLNFTRRADERNFSLGLSSHYGRGKNLGMIDKANVQRPVDSWGVAADYALPLSKFFTLSGEAFEGRALGLFNEPAGEAILPVGTRGEHGVETRGGWAQASVNLNAMWQINLAYGIDVPNASQLRVGDRFRNQTYVGNVIYKFSPNVTFALEYRRLLTDFRNQAEANERGDHVNLAAAYTF
jgi:hypothetical protein